MKRMFLAGCCAATMFVGSEVKALTPYEAAVRVLEPTYYYQLNEPDDSGGVVDSMGNAPDGEYNGDYGLTEDGLAEAGCAGPLFTNEGQDGSGVFEYYETAVPGVGGEANLAHCSNNVGHINLGPSENYGASAMTVSMFFKADFAEGGDRLFTNNLTDPATSFQLNVANDGLVVAVDPALTGDLAERSLYNLEGSGPDRALIQAEYGWFHVVASTSGNVGERAENIQVWVNGVNRTDTLVISDVGWGTNTVRAKIGGRRENPTDSTTHSGAQDEVSIWLDRVLTEEEVQSLWQAALADVPPTRGDFNLDGVLDESDINDLTVASATGENNVLYDLTEDGLVNSDDVTEWIRADDIFYSWIGDSDLDGEFKSDDVILVLSESTYEQDVDAVWTSGDWNGSGRATSQDVIDALADGGYENGPRTDVAAVPEPAGLVLVLFGMLGIMTARRR